jgi:2-polyprenyl-3-methyl-5-hydroxy-6-metoxy-1,4-benzoquinol methylase
LQIILNLLKKKTKIRFLTFPNLNKRVLTYSIEHCMKTLINPEIIYSDYRPEMLAFIPSDAKKLLDIGCSTGLFGKQIKSRQTAEIWGVELNEKAVVQAIGRLDKVITGNIFDVLDDLPNAYFDCIIFNDLLEHLIDPYSLLSQISQKLGNGGVIVSSIPNVRFILNLRSLLIYKDWKYEDYGILDRTHLRFFTLNSIKYMFNSLGFKITLIKGINPINTFKFKLFNLFTFRLLNDTKFPQYACVVTLLK